jgi:hypothetical protein
MFNGVMLTLSLSGIDLKTFALTTYFDDLIISLDANRPDNILLIESEKPRKTRELREAIESAQLEIKNLFDKFKRVLMRKIN